MRPLAVHTAGWAARTCARKGRLPPGNRVSKKKQPQCFGPAIQQSCSNRGPLCQSRHHMRQRRSICRVPPPGPVDPEQCPHPHRSGGPAAPAAAPAVRQTRRCGRPRLGAGPSPLPSLQAGGRVVCRHVSGKSITVCSWKGGKGWAAGVHDPLVDMRERRWEGRGSAAACHQRIRSPGVQASHGMHGSVSAKGSRKRCLQCACQRA